MMFQIGQQIIASLANGQNIVGTIRGVGNGEYYMESPGYSGWVSAAAAQAYTPSPYQPPMQPTGILPSLIPPILQPILNPYIQPQYPAGYPQHYPPPGPYGPHWPPWGHR